MIIFIIIITLIVIIYSLFGFWGIAITIALLFLSAIHLMVGITAAGAASGGYWKTLVRLSKELFGIAVTRPTVDSKWLDDALKGKHKP